MIGGGVDWGEGGRGLRVRLGRRLEEVAEAGGGSYCRLRMPLRLALGVRETVAGHRLRALEGGGGGAPPPANTSVNEGGKGVLGDCWQSLLHCGGLGIEASGAIWGGGPGGQHSEGEGGGGCDHITSHRRCCTTNNPRELPTSGALGDPVGLHCTTGPVHRGRAKWAGIAPFPSGWGCGGVEMPRSVRCGCRTF